jgi:hypothetical protein
MGSAHPGAHTSRIQMHEIRLRIVANTAEMRPYGKIPQTAATDAGKPHVDGATLGMQAFSCHTLAARAQLVVGGW